MNETDEGKKLYEEYIKSYKAWIQYIEMKIKYKQSEFLSKNNKKYYKYDYLSMYDNITNLYNEKSLTESTQSAESKLKYKKLSLLFHPDKFNITTSIFSFINKHKSNIKILELLDSISDNILDKTKEEIDNIITKLDNEKFINNIINLKSVENKNYWNLINTTNEIIEDKYTEDYLNSITQSAGYKYYMNENDGEKALISNYFTIDELKEEIKKSYDKIFLEYYKNICNNDNEIVNLIENRMKELTIY
jgi:hypothetical protein